MLIISNNVNLFILIYRLPMNWSHKLQKQLFVIYLIREAVNLIHIADYSVVIYSKVNYFITVLLQMKKHQTELKTRFFYVRS